MRTRRKGVVGRMHLDLGYNTFVFSVDMTCRWVGTEGGEREREELVSLSLWLLAACRVTTTKG